MEGTGFQPWVNRNVKRAPDDVLSRIEPRCDVQISRLVLVRIFADPSTRVHTGFTERGRLLSLRRHTFEIDTEYLGHFQGGTCRTHPHSGGFDPDCGGQ